MAEQAAPSYAKDILPLFTPIDIEHMAPMGVCLDDYKYMSQPANAASVYAQLQSKRMPPSSGGGNGPWPDPQIALFQHWMEGGYLP